MNRSEFAAVPASDSSDNTDMLINEPVASDEEEITPPYSLAIVFVIACNACVQIVIQVSYKIWIIS